jgi:protein required for attachment to host cells
MAQKTTWCLVCDASRAHLFRTKPPGRPYELIASFDHPEGRARVGDLVADANGRKPVGGSRGVGVVGSRPGGFHGRPGAEAETDPRDVEAQKFARDLAATLERGLDAHAYEALVLVAPPRFLGMVKATVSGQVAKRVEETIDKDLAAMEPREIERRVRAERAG